MLDSTDVRVFDSPGRNRLRYWIIIRWKVDAEDREILSAHDTFHHYCYHWELYHHFVLWYSL
jgi:hypothetical protein